MDATPHKEINERTTDTSIFSFQRMKFRYHYACKYLKPGLVLDIGCGLGFGCEYLPSSRYQYVGIDYSPETVTLARQRYPQASFESMSVPPLQFPAGSFQNILCLELIEHLPMEQAPILLGECRRILKEGGILFLTTPNSKNRGKSMPAGHVYEYNIPEIRNMFLQSGFSILHQGGLFLSFYKNRYKENWFSKWRSKLYKAGTPSHTSTTTISSQPSIEKKRYNSSFYGRVIRLVLQKMAQCLNWLGYQFPSLAEYQVWVLAKENTTMMTKGLPALETLV